MVTKESMNWIDEKTLNKHVFQLLKILDFFSKNYQTTYQELMDYLSCSRNTVINRIQELNTLVPFVSIEKLRGQGVMIHFEDSSSLTKAYSKIWESSVVYTIFNVILVYPGLTHEEIYNLTGYSIFKIRKALTAIEEQAKPYNISITKSKICLTGKEIDIRKFIYESYQYFYNGRIIEFNSKIPLLNEFFKFSFEYINEITDKFNIDTPIYAQANQTILMTISVMRIRTGNQLPNINNNFLNELSYSLEYTLAKAFLTKVTMLYFNNLSFLESDIVFLGLPILLNSSTINKKNSAVSTIEKFYPFRKISKEFVKLIDNECELSDSQKEDVLFVLNKHFLKTAMFVFFESNHSTHYKQQNIVVSSLKKLTNKYPYIVSISPEEIDVILEIIDKVDKKYILISSTHGATKEKLIENSLKNFFPKNYLYFLDSEIGELPLNIEFDYIISDYNFYKEKKGNLILVNSDSSMTIINSILESKNFVNN